MKPIKERFDEFLKELDEKYTHEKTLEEEWKYLSEMAYFATEELPAIIRKEELEELLKKIKNINENN